MNRPGKILLFILLICATFSSLAQNRDFKPTGHNPWTDSLINQMTLEEKIGQLFMIPVYTNRDNKHQREIEKMIEDHQIGGLIFMQGGPVRQANTTNELQEKSNIPVLVAQDAEWGLGMRLDSTHSFPRQLTLGAIHDHRLVYEYGKEVARQCKRIGVHMNFAPVVDVNNNINNPVINDRSFGENRYAVTLRGIQYMNGMQQNGVMACAKHFPGHGDTETDSHYDLPLIPHGRERLDSIELFPFRILTKQGVISVMTAHLNIPALEPQQNLASSLSENVVTGILKKEMGYDGLIITDALNMRGATEYQEPGEMEMKAFLAGNDILLFPQDIPKTVELFKAAIDSGTISMERLNYSVRKILNAKYWLGLDDYQPVKIEGIYEDLNNESVDALHHKIIANAMTLAANQEKLIPFKLIDTVSFATLTIGGESEVFENSFSRYADADHFEMRNNASGNTINSMVRKLSKYDMVVVNVFDMSRFASKEFGIHPNTISTLLALQQRTNLVIVLYGSPYSLNLFDFAKNVVVAYEETEYSEDLVPQFLFGGIPVNGKLPVSVSDKFSFGVGELIKQVRLGYGHPEEIGIASYALDSIDTIVKEALDKKATPGCQVLVAKDGKVIYHKAFGHYTYEDKRTVKLTDLYDLASITKMAATTVSLMYLFDNKLVDLNTTLSDYLPQLQNTNLEKLELKDILTHTAGLQAWIPFYGATVKNDSVYDFYYSNKPDTTYTVKVAEDLYMRKIYEDSVLHRIINSHLRYPIEYQYSDLGFYLFKKIIEAVTRTGIDTFAQEIFYKPLGLQTMTYNPLGKFPKDRIVPTEDDRYFRKQLLQGYVHDPGAAMWGGVSGHAGLFSNANDLAILMQMLLNYGTYGGERFLNESTVKFFTTRHTTLSRRGYGFDKPVLEDGEPGPTSDLVSKNAFGHTGFTGTTAWADPKHDIIYVFLSNRIHPSASNRKLISMDIRTRIQGVIYRALKKDL